MNKFLCYIAVVFALVSACKKDTHPRIVNNGETGPTLQLIAGGGQTANAGTALKDSIVIKITEPGKPSDKFFAEIFQDTISQGNILAQKHILNDSQFSYSWVLSDRIGLQTLRFVILDSTLTVIDTISVKANALQGWQVSGGIEYNNLYVNSFARLSTGRLLAGIMGAYNPYYSDDNGKTWASLTSFYMNYYPWAVKIVVSPADEIFIGSELNGVFYSDDGGATWQNRNNGLPSLAPIADLVYTAAGKLIYTTSGSGIYTSANNGLNWATIISHNQSSQISNTYMATQSNGDIYFIQNTIYGATLERLDHTDLKLHPVTGLPVQIISAYYIDENGSTYAAGLNGKNAELYQLSGNNTWSKIFTVPVNKAIATNTIMNISKQGDGYYYFATAGGYYKTADFKTFEAIPATIPVNSFQYIVAANNSLVINSLPQSIWYYPQ